jgi:isochorismate pyruvate lyase
MTTLGSEEVLAPLRARIDSIDEKIVGLIAERTACVGEVIVLKKRDGLPARIESRVEEVVAHVRGKAEEAGAPPDLADVLWRIMIDWFIAYEQKHLTRPMQGAGESE